MKDITQLIQNLLSGSEQAWHTFVDDYGRYIWYCILRVANRYGCHLSLEDEQDLYQDVFAVLIEKGLKKFRGRDKPHLLAYIHRITIHHTINYLKRRRKNVSIETFKSSWEGYALILKDMNIVSPDEETLYLEKIDQLKRLLDSLRPEEKHFLEMCYLEGLSPREIAKRSSITISNFYVRKSRILNKLKNITLNLQMILMRGEGIS